MTGRQESDSAVQALADLLAGLADQPEQSGPLEILCRRADEGFFYSHQSSGALGALAKTLLQSLASENPDAA